MGAIAHADAQAMGVHQRIHGIRALTAYMVPNGMFTELLEGSEGLLELITEDSGRVCDFGGGALLGRALALFEMARTEEGVQAVEFFQGALPDVARIPIVELQAIERVRPFVGLEHAERLLANVHEVSAPVHHLYSIRARLPMAALRTDWSEVDDLIAQARELAEQCCAPQILAFADWAQSVREGAVSRAQAALTALDEPYTAARLAVDFLGTIPTSEATEFRAATEKTLESMGAVASLTELLSA